MSHNSDSGFTDDPKLNSEPTNNDSMNEGSVNEGSDQSSTSDKRSSRRRLLVGLAAAPLIVASSAQTAHATYGSGTATSTGTQHGGGDCWWWGCHDGGGYDDHSQRGWHRDRYGRWHYDQGYGGGGW